MHVYPLLVLVLGGMVAFIGAQVLGLWVLTRQRLHAMVGVLGILAGLYCGLCFGLYSAHGLAQGKGWQFWQLVTASVMGSVVILTGLEYLGRLRVRHAVGVAALTLLMVAPLWVPGMGLTDIPRVKNLDWLGLRYYEAELGLVPSAFYLMGVLWMAHVAIQLVKRAIHGSRGDRGMAAVYGLWWVAGVNDVLVSSGVYTSLYLIEFGFFLLILELGWRLIGAERFRGQRVEEQLRGLALQMMAKDRDLARAQAELTEAAKLAAVGQLAAGVAHEVNNPLTYVMSNLEILQGELRNQPHQQELVSEALEGTQRISRVVRQLSNFARATPERRTGGVAAAADSALKMAMPQLKDRAKVDVVIPELPSVGMDEAKLAQVLLNLMVNAAQSIEAGQRDQNYVRLEAKLDGDGVEIDVEDSGNGIRPEALPHIFEPFYTTKGVGEGQGLGLAISRELVHRAGGRISAENVEPHGARFRLWLPVEESSRASVKLSNALPCAANGQATDEQCRYRVLLVDDDPVVLHALERTLRRSCQVTTTVSGREALSLLKTPDAYDIVLCDLMMPDGSGQDVVRGMAEDCPAMLDRLILMTGAGTDGRREHVVAGRAFLLLHKPFRLADFQAMAWLIMAKVRGSHPPSDPGSQGARAAEGEAT